jgi:hypothetical protein
LKCEKFVFIKCKFLNKKASQKSFAQGPATAKAASEGAPWQLVVNSSSSEDSCGMNFVRVGSNRGTFRYRSPVGGQGAPRDGGTRVLSLPPTKTKPEYKTRMARLKSADLIANLHTVRKFARANPH